MKPVVGGASHEWWGVLWMCSVRVESLKGSTCDGLSLKFKCEYI